MSAEYDSAGPRDDTAARIAALVEQGRAMLKKSPEQGLEYGKQALALAELAPQGADTAAIHDLLGKANEYSGNHVEAIRCFEQALALQHERGDRNWEALCLRNIGNANFHLSRYDETLAAYSRSLELTEEIGDRSGSAGTLNNIGAVYTHITNYEKALEYYIQSLDKMEEIGDKLGIACAANNIGVIYKMLNNFGKALEYYKRSLAIKEEIGAHRDIVGSLNNIGIIYFKSGDYCQAADYAERSLRLGEEVGDQQGIANALMSLGNVHGAAGRHQLSMDHYLRANRICSDIGAGYETADSLLSVGKSCTVLGLLDRAADNLDQCRLLCQQINARNILQDCYTALSDLSAARGEYQQALEHYKRYVETKDSIFTEESGKKLAEMQTKYETERKEKEAEIYRLRNVELAEAKQIIEEKNKHITSSIEYARRIQQAILPTAESMSAAMPEHFVLFRPRDIVSGDFYWFSQMDDTALIAVVDCTGHGVPGAFMSMIGSMLLNAIVNENRTTDPAVILQHMHDEVRFDLKQGGAEAGSTDGMDICLCSIDGKNGELTFAGANRPLYLVRGTELTEITGDGKSVGGRQKEEKRVFSNKRIELRCGDMVYLTSDGYADQCDTDGRKIGSKRLKELLAGIAGQAPADQCKSLLAELGRHQGAEEQRDDIAIIGLRMPGKAIRG